MTGRDAHNDDRGADRRLADAIRRAMPHSHDHTETSPLADTGAAGVRASKISLVGLGATAAVQAVLVVVTGSVALLSDTLHNLTDALTPFLCGSRSRWGGERARSGSRSAWAGPRTWQGW